jgi:putative phage-type endonuclease
MIFRKVPKSREQWLAWRAQDVTSTEVAALFRLSPYATEFKLYQQKTGALDAEIEETERMTWGKRLERSVAMGFGADQGWKIRAMNQYVRDPDARIGASFDFEIVGHPDGPGVLEVKIVDRFVFKDQWIDEGGKVEAPPHIELQLAAQLMLTERRWGVILALVGGNTIKWTRRERDPIIESAIREKAAAFWKRIADETPPDPDYGKDADVIVALHQHVDPGKVLDARGDEMLGNIAGQYSALGKQAKAIKDQRDALKAQMLERIGDAEKTILAAGSISAKALGETPIAASVRKGYRDFRVTIKEPK